MQNLHLITVEIASRVQVLVMLFFVIICFVLLVAYNIKSSKIILYSNAFSRNIKDSSVTTALMDTGYLSAPESRYLYYEWIFSQPVSLHQ